MNDSMPLGRRMRLDDSPITKVDGKLDDFHLTLFKRRYNKSGLSKIMKELKAGALSKTEKRKKKDKEARTRRRKRRR